MADISEEELEWIADKLFQYAENDSNFRIISIYKTQQSFFVVNFSYEGTNYGSFFQYEQNKK